MTSETALRDELDEDVDVEAAEVEGRLAAGWMTISMCAYEMGSSGEISSLARTSANWSSNGGEEEGPDLMRLALMKGRLSAGVR